MNIRKNFKKFIGSLLAITLVLSLIPCGQFVNAKSAAENKALCDVDFSRTDVSDLDDTFQASANGVQVDSVSDVWEKSENPNGNYDVNTADATTSVNVALKGKVDMEYVNWPFTGTSPALLTDGVVDNTGNTYVMSKLSSTQDSEKTATVTFLNNHYYDINKVQIYWRSNGNGCPVDFEIQAFNGTDWVSVASETDFSRPQGGLYTKEIESICCNAIRIVATKLGKNGTSYTLELCEVEAYHDIAGDNVAKSGIASMEIMPFLAKSGHSAKMLNDGAYTYTSTDYAADADTVKEAEIAFFDKCQVTDVVISWRDSRGCPQDFEIQAYNGTEWVTVASETGYTYTSGTKYNAQITPTVCSAIKLNVTKLGAVDGKYALQLSEIEIYGGIVQAATVGGTASTEIASWSTAKASYLNDGLFYDYTISELSTDSVAEKTATVAFVGNSFYKIDSVGVVWRDSRGCPSEFKIQVYNGLEWITVAEESSYVYSDRLYRKAIKPIVANAVRIAATKLGKDGNNYVLEISELQAWGIKRTNIARAGTAVADIPDWGGKASQLNDGNISEKVLYAVSKMAESTRIATINFPGGKLYNLDGVNIYWYGKQGCPVDFKVEAYNGNNWVEIASETDYSCPSDNVYKVNAQSAYGTAIRLVATKLSIFSGSDYTLALNEIEVFGELLNTLSTKTSKADNSKQLLTLKSGTVKNFRAQITMLNHNSTNTTYGLMFGQTEQTATDGAKLVRPYLSQGAIFVDGIKKNSAKYLDSDCTSGITGDISLGSFNYGQDAVTYAYSKGSITKFNSNVNTTNMQTLNVEVFEGIVKVWYTNFEDFAWTAQLDDDYNGGYVSLLCSGNDEGGLKNFKLTAYTGDDLSVNGNVMYSAAGKYTVVTLNSDYANGLLNTCDFAGKLKYDSDKFQYRTIAFYNSGSMVSGIETEISALNGILSFNLKQVPADTVIKFYFENNNGKNIFDLNNCFNLSTEDISFTASDGSGSQISVAAPTLEFDYTGNDGEPDLKLDIRDLVRAKKLLANGDTGLSADTLVQISKTLLGLGGAEVEALCASSLNDVFVDASYIGLSNGTESAPFKSLEFAFYNVKNDGVVHIVGKYSLSKNNAHLGFNGKRITITGDALDISNANTVDIVGALTLDNLTVTANNNTIYANGFEFTINENTAFNGAVKNLFGGSDGIVTLTGTNLKVCAGNFLYIYGGSNGGIITGDTKIQLGGAVNKAIDVSDHSVPNFAAAGSLNGTVKGNTNITVSDEAKMSIVYGGGYGAYSCVRGVCNVNVNGGNIMGYYGGSNAGTVYETDFVMTGGRVEQIFGGSWNSSVTGNTAVTVSGGTVTRRIYAGCYNDTEADSSYHVIGQSTLTLKNGVKFTATGSLERALCAASRTVDSAEEKAVLRFETQELYNKLSGYICNLFTKSTAYDELYIGNGN